MAKPLSAQSLRGDARFDLDAQYDDLVSIADQVQEMDKAWAAFRAHILRRAAAANRKRHQAITSLDAADEREAFAKTGLAVV